MAIYALEDRILFDAAGPGDNDASADTTQDTEQTPIESEPTPEQQNKPEQPDPTDESQPASQSENTSYKETNNGSEENTTENSNESSNTDSNSTQGSDQSDSDDSAESTDGQDDAADTVPSESSSQTDDKQLTSETREEETKEQIAFVSDSLSDKEAIIEALEEEEIEVVVVGATDSGLETISDTLEGREEVDVVHIFSHGGDGHFTLGTDVIDSQNLDQNRELFNSWPKALAEDGDINLYGCKIAESDSGKSFVDKLAKHTGADVAASTDNTGSPSTSGDWELEYNTGPVTSSLSLGKVSTLSSLATYTVDTDQDVVDAGDGLTSLREAIDLANNNAGADEIIFADSLGTATITLGGTELLITDSLTINGEGRITIDGNKESRILNINDSDDAVNLDVTLSGLTIQNGEVDGHGAGVYSRENLTISNSTITGNESTKESYGYGAGIYAWVTSDGSIEIENSTITNNSFSGDYSAGAGLFINNYSSGDVTILNSTISNNFTSGNYVYGGGIFARNHDNGTITIQNSTISDNSGAGIRITNYESGTITIQDSTITNNESPRKGGGIHLNMDGSGTATISSSTISGNTSTGSGAGIYIYCEGPGTVLVENSTISDNSTTGGGAAGGGIDVYNYEDGTITIKNSTISGNSTAGENARGGGIHIDNYCYDGGDGTVTIQNSTISGNSTTGENADGGGIFVSNDYYGTITIENSTISDNSTAGSSADGGGVFTNNSSTNSTIEITSTIIANNSAGATGTDLYHDDDGITNVTYSLIETTDGHSVDNNTGNGPDTDNNNIVGQDPMLAPLADNGGPTMTHMLLFGSPAINAGANPSNLTTDQRGDGYSRDDGNGVDIGAVEGVLHIVDNLIDEKDSDYGDGDYSLREALGNANHGDKIIFSDDLNDAPDSAGTKNFIGDTGTIYMTQAASETWGGDFIINKSLTIDGDSRITIDARPDDATDAANRIFNINDSNAGGNLDVTLAGLTIQNGNVDGKGGGVYIFLAKRVCINSYKKIDFSC